MEFNSFLWDLYRNSADGRAAIERDVSDHRAPETRNVAAFTVDLCFCEVLNGEFIPNGMYSIDTVSLRDLINAIASDRVVTSLDEAEALFTEIVDDGLSWSFDENGKTFEALFAGGDDDGYMDVIANIEGLSTGLHDAHSQFFVPYLFPRRFDVLDKICHAFAIPLPQAPGKLKKRDRATFYLTVNRELQNFRNAHGLTPQELNAFIYDFAPKNLVATTSNELPQPSRIWFVIGGVGKNGDFEYLDKVDESSISHWQGNLETRRGDIVLMWCASPRSYLHSVWRALDEGFNDPFFYYYAMVRVGHPVKITPITFSEFSRHPFLGTRPAVRARFQGASGTALSLEDYEAICELLRNKGFDLSQLPSPPDVKEYFVSGIEDERGVEVNLLEPLLRNLGYSETDWVRQLPVRMGRGERNYPDYVLGCDLRPSEESGIAVIESKFDIRTNKELKEAFVQAKSYALRLQASILILAARRGLWIFMQRTDGFSIDHFHFKTWEEISHPDVLHIISVVMGKRAINKLVEQRNKVSRRSS